MDEDAASAPKAVAALTIIAAHPLRASLTLSAPTVWAMPPPPLLTSASQSFKGVSSAGHVLVLGWSQCISSSLL